MDEINLQATTADQPIKIARAFMHLRPFTSLGEGITDELAEGWENYADPYITPVLTARLSYAEERGWASFPADISFDKATGKFNKKSHKSAKYSKGANWGKTRDPEKIREDFSKWPKANVGVPTGEDNGFWVCEADTLKGHNVDGIASLRALEKKHGALPKTLMAESPSGSLHYYFNWPKGVVIKNPTSAIAPGIDVRGEGGMVIAPPSVRDDGEYRWLNDYPIADAPQWLLELVTTKPKRDEPLPRLEIAEAFKGLDPDQSLGAGIEDFPPLPLQPILDGCGWLREAHDTGGKNYNQPQWNLTTLAAVFLENGHECAHQFGNQHPKYTPESTDKIWERKNREHEENGVGWPSCEEIKAAGSKHCKACKHFAAKPRSPLHLAGEDEIPHGLFNDGMKLENDKKLPMIVELGSRLWGPATVNGNEYRFGEDQSKVIDPRKGTWFDFTTNKGGYIKELMKKVETTAHRKQPNADDVVLVCAADVVSRPLDWIWEGHLLRGSQELMSGLPDLSKSTVQISYVACATGRVPWPNGAVAIEPMNVIMLTAEDTLDQIVVPRLCAAGADLNRVSFLKCIKTDDKDRQFLLAEDLDRLECLVQKIGNVGLITIDPITAYMGGRMDSHKATEVRSQLGPLKDFAERTNTALSTITHPAKVAGARALNHFIGSQAFIAACRVGHLCIAEMEERDDQFIPTGRVLFTNVRNTAYRQLMPTLVYRKEEVIVSKEPRLITAPKIVWDGPLDITAEAAIAAASGKKPDQQLKVQAFLHEILKDGKPALQKEIEEAAEVKGFTKKQLRVAREKLGVHVAKKPGKMTGPWFWRLPSHF